MRGGPSSCQGEKKHLAASHDSLAEPDTSRTGRARGKHQRQAFPHCSGGFFGAERIVVVMLAGQPALQFGMGRGATLGIKRFRRADHHA